MSSPFCRGCGARVEWHPRTDGRLVAIDPDPHPEGTLTFVSGMKLATMTRGSRPRMYRPHLVGCSNPEKAKRAAADEPTERVCYRCRMPGHFANVCEEEIDDG